MNARYGPGGALVTDEAPAGMGDVRPLDDDCAEYYGGRYLIAETMTRSTAEAIAKAFGMTIEPTKENA